MDIQYDVNKECWLYNGKTLEEEEQEQNQVYTPQDLEELGIVDEAAQLQKQGVNNDSALAQIDEFMGYDSRPSGMVYEKLNAWETLKDVGMAVGTEASHIFLPKEYETQYTERTHLAETLKYMYRYGAGTIGLGKFGAVLKGIQGGGKLAKAARGAGAFLSPQFYKGKNQLVKTATAGIDDLGAATIATFLLRRSEDEEGQFADMFGDNAPDFIKALQTNENDTELQEKLKGMLGDTAAGIITAPVFAGAFNMLGKALSRFKGNKGSKQALAAVEEAVEKLDTLSEKEILVKKTDEAIAKANETNIEDVERFIKGQDFVNKDTIDEVMEIYNARINNLSLDINQDGKISIKINNWREAANLSEKDLRRQTDNDGINLMNEAVKDTWHERGMLADDNLIKVTLDSKDPTKPPKITVNQSKTNEIVNYYKDKWQLDNKIKVIWENGEIKGSDGNTTATTYLGKTSKNTQIAIDKKKLQIKQLEDKLTYELGTNAEVMETNKGIQEQIKIAKAELKQLEDTKAKKNLIPEITIKINKNAKNPYAVFRSELEHARDIAKGEVPKQSEKHFNRYNGKNESEMSLEYVKKKADTRAGKNQSKEELIDELFGIPQQESKFDNFISDVSKTETTLGKLFGDDEFYQAEGIIENIKDIKISKIPAETLAEETGKGYRTLAELVLNENDDIIGIRVNSDVTGEELEFNLLHEIRHTQQDLKTRAAAEELASNLKTETDVDNYNALKAEKDANDYAKALIKRKKEFYNEQRTRQENATNADGVESGSILQGNSGRGINGLHGEEVEGAGLGYQRQYRNGNTPAERIKATNGDLNEVDNIINDVINSDVKLSGTDWEAAAKDSDELYAMLKDRGINNLKAFKEAFAKGDVNLVNMMTRKVLAAERFISDFTEQAKQMMKSGEDITEMSDVINYLIDYCQDIGSGYGRGLNEQKFRHKTHNFFSMTTLEKQGFSGLVDLLKNDLTSLNFTQSVKQNKEILYEKIRNYFDGKFFEQLLQDQNFTKDFDKMITKVIQEKSPDILEKEFEKLNKKGQKEAFENILKYATDTRAVMKSLKYQKTAATYYINNLLSSPRTQVKNIVSGIANTFYFPMQKIVGGFISDMLGIGDNSVIIKEGLYTYQALTSGDTIKEAFKLGYQCFKDGDGRMISLGKHSQDNMEKTLLDFMTWDELKTNKNPFEIISNLYTIGCRFMGATDEFITQLNYRSVIKAKALTEAEQGAKLLGLEGKTKADFIANISQDRFNQAFTLEGQPTNMEAYGEARDVVLQGSLDGKYYNPLTKKREQVREQTVLMSVSAKIQEMAFLNPFVKFFFPFVRTNTNIAQANLNHNGIYQAITSIVSPQHREMLLSPTMEGARMRGQIGMGILSAGTALTFVMQGNVTGAEPVDSKTREALYKTGWKPYSIRIGNKWWSYEGYEPFQSILGFMADCYTLTQSYDTSLTNRDNIGLFIQKGTKAFFNNFLDKASFRGSIGQISSLWEAIEREDEVKLEELIARQVRGALPLVSLGNWVSNQFGESSPTKPEGFTQTLFSRYFGKGLGDYRRNIWGERQDLYYNIISTGYEENTTIEEEELTRLAEQGWSLSELQATERKINSDYREYKGGNEYRSLYDRILETQSTITLDGKTLRKAMEELILSEDYQKADDGIEITEQGTKYTKINMLKALYNKYKQAAKEETIKEYGEYYVNKKGNTIAEEYRLLKEAQEARLIEKELEEDLENIRSF